MEKYENNLSIKEWAEDDRPREKLLKNGRKSLSKAELLALLLGSGSIKESAVDLARRVLKTANNNFYHLRKYSLKDLQAFHGIGEAKAITIAAGLEVGVRIEGENIPKRQKVTDSTDAFDALKGIYRDLPYEEFHVLLLNKANQVIDKILVSKGGVSGTVADPRVIFKPALEQLASSLILSHNHPSGNLRPSRQDVQLTKKIKDCGKLMDIPVLDHLIISEGEYYSFADEGKL
ncbi:MAG: DNA repair protein RadC [Flavobacteriales bacterium]